MKYFGKLLISFLFTLIVATQSLTMQPTTTIPKLVKNITKRKILDLNNDSFLCLQQLLLKGNPVENFQQMLEETEEYYFGMYHNNFTYQKIGLTLCIFLMESIEFCEDDDPRIQIFDLYTRLPIFELCLNLLDDILGSIKFKPCSLIFESTRLYILLVQNITHRIENGLKYKFYQEDTIKVFRDFAFLIFRRALIHVRNFTCNLWRYKTPVYAWKEIFKLFNLTVEKTEKFCRYFKWKKLLAEARDLQRNLR